jgi:phosphoribosylglycinamide formyltransferase-1
MNKLRVGALISGGGTNLQAIIDACEQGEIQARIAFVGSDKPGVHGLERARKKGIPTFVVDYGAIIRSFLQAPEKTELPQDFNLEEIRHKQNFFQDPDRETESEIFLKTRAVAEAQLLAQMAPYDAELLVLAGFMRNLTPYFIDRVNIDPAKPRIMNIHPALLPAFPGTDGYGDTFRYGCKIGGCSVHFIDYGEDSGPIIGQMCFPITAEDTLDSVRKKGLELEWELYPQCIQLFAQNRLHVVKLTYTGNAGQIHQRSVVEIIQPA